MKKIIKNNIKVFISIIISAVIFTGVGVYAATQYNASQIEYKKNGQTTVEGALNDLYELSNPVLLWTNPNPNSEFGPQTISLNLNDYKYVIIITKDDIEGTVLSSLLAPVGGYSNTLGIGSSSNSVRKLRVTTAGIIVEDCYYGKYTDNGTVKPYKIYGIKHDINIQNKLS